MKKKIAIWTGYSESFNSDNYTTKKMGGSELSLLRFIKEFCNDYDIFVFNCYNFIDNIKIINGVHWTTQSEYHKYDFEWDILIIFRYINFFLYCKHRAKKTILWLEDMVINYYYSGQIIYDHASHLTFNLYNKIDKFVCLSKWHIQNMKIHYPFIEDKKYQIIKNPVDLEFFYNKQLNIKDVDKIKNRFVYVSDLSRGFNLLLDCLIYLQNIYPDISLSFFRSNTLTPDLSEKIKKLNNVFQFGYESTEIVNSEILKAEYFFYPAIFKETFCCSAIEAQLFSCVCIYNNIGCLNETIGDRGLQINHDFNSPNYVEKTCLDIIKLFDNHEAKKLYIMKGKAFALTTDMKNLKNDWLSILE